MTDVRKRLALATVLAALAGSALAQTPPSPPPGPAAAGAPRGAASGPRDPARWQQRHERHMGELKQQLQLTPAQEGAWNQYTSAMRPPANMPRPDHDAMARLTTPERIDQMRAMRQQHQVEMDRRADATKAFYAQLSPEQKKRFDETTARKMQHGPRGGHPHHGGHGGHGGHGMHEGMHGGMGMGPGPAR